MKKNYFYSMMAASMLLATSCSQDEIVDVTKGEGQKMTFKVELPANASSRTVGGVEIGAGTQADNLIYAMYEHGKENVLVSGVTTDAEDGANDGTFTVTVPMAKDIKYDLLFFAYNEDNCAFEIASDAKATNLKTLTFKADQTPNVDAFDAFVGRKSNQGITTASTTSVELKRPFAQVNAATTLQDLKDASRVGADVVKSQLRIKGIPTTYNVLSEEATGTQEVTYTATSILVRDNVQEGEYSNEPITVDGNTYYYLTLAYVLAGEGSSTHEATFEFLRTGDEKVSTLPILNLPIQRNYRTNVVGNLVTKQESYTITIDAEFGEPAQITPVNEVEAATLPEIQEGINDAVENVPTIIKPTGNITLGSSTYSRSESADFINIPAGKNIILDLNGYTISGVDNTSKNFGLIQNNGKLTIKDSSTGNTGRLILEATVNSGWNRYSAVISNNPGGTLIVEGGYIEHLGGTDMAYGIDILTNGGIGDVNATINGGTIKSTYRAVRQFLNSTTKENNLIINGGTIEGANKGIFFHDPSKNANKGKLVVAADATVNGGVYLYVTEGSTEWPVEVSIAASAVGENGVISANVPEGYVVDEINGNYTIQVVGLSCDTVKKIYSVSNAYGLIALSEMTIGGGYSVKLAADIDLEGFEFNGLNAFNPENKNTFDGENHTISNWTNSSKAADMGFIKNWVGTIKNIKFENCHLKTAGRSAVVAAKPYANIENVSVNNCSIEDSYWACGIIAGLYNSGSVLNCTVTNSSVKSNGGVGGIVGVINETAGERKLENCSVSNSTIYNTGAYGEVYSGGALVGMFNAGDATYKFVGCSVKNNTLKGSYVFDKYPADSTAKIVEE